jgi:hypothetical protein
MKRSSGYLIGILLSIFVSACANIAPATDERPAWIDNPGNGVSASAGMNVRGRAAQEELAIARAREEFARRFGVSVDATHATTTDVSNGQMRVVGHGESVETTNQTDVRAMVKAKWRDEAADVLYVWLVPAN